jgi:type IV pilus assembly protein PilW
MGLASTHPLPNPSPVKGEGLKIFQRNAAGFSLVELMIAMVLGLLVAEGVYVLFAATGKVNTTQNALSRLQENGRIAMSMLADDLRSAGSLPCGSHGAPVVYADDLAAHIAGRPQEAAAPVGAVSDTPYPLDRGVFLGGSKCTQSSCDPAVVGVPQAGLAVGNKIPGTDVLVVRELQGDGLPVGTTGQVCDADGHVTSLNVHSVPGNTVLAGLKSAHLALLAGCMQSQIFSADVQGNAVRPLLGHYGNPACATADAQTRLFDLDAQLQTSIYYLQLVADDKNPRRKIAALMRRANGVANEVVQGVERFDLRYSLTDAAGNAYWLSAADVARHVSADGAALQCGDGSSRPCAWQDVNAVEITLLVNTVDDLPTEASASAWDYRYSIDGDRMQSPTGAMPVTGLPSGRMLRREFRTVVALRGLEGA